MGRSAGEVNEIRRGRLMASLLVASVLDAVLDTDQGSCLKTGVVPLQADRRKTMETASTVATPSEL